MLYVIYLTIILFTSVYLYFYTCTYSPSQNMPIAHAKLADVLDPVMDLYEDVKRKCLMRLEYENLMKSEAITSPTSKFYQKPLDYAMWKYAYYVCHKCNKVKIQPMLVINSKTAYYLYHLSSCFVGLLRRRGQLC